MPDLEKEMHALGRLSARYRLGEWFSAGCEIWMGRTVIGYTRTPEAARYISRLHNIYQILANEAIVLRTEVKDLRKVLSVRSLV